jgi:hypothetical protein
LPRDKSAGARCTIRSSGAGEEALDSHIDA